MNINRIKDTLNEAAMWFILIVAAAFIYKILMLIV